MSPSQERAPEMPGSTGRETVGEALRWGAERLARAGIEAPRREARLLLARALGRSVEWVLAHPEGELGDLPDYGDLVRRREDREPVSHILGEREFWSLPFRVGRDVLDPRPDSETLVELALAQFPACDRPLRVLDLGVGSGCLLLSFLSERPLAFGVGVDFSPAALAVARENARALGLEKRCAFMCGDWADSLSGSFDLILANPPYIPEGEIDGLAPEVARFEPRTALAGGPDGLDCYRALAPGIAALIAPRGKAIVEFGIGQAEAVGGIFEGAGMTLGDNRSDLSGRPRCLLLAAGAAQWLQKKPLE